MKTNIRPSHFLFLFCLVLSFVLTGCPSKQKVPPFEAAPSEEVQSEALAEQPPPPAYFVHTVSLQGESLSIIAKWYTGDLMNWETLAQHNPTINPNRIFKGDQIQIPRDLLVREDAMPQAFVDESQPPAKRKATSVKPAAQKPAEEPAKEPVTPEGVPLFGPKDYSK